MTIESSEGAIVLWTMFGPSLNSLFLGSFVTICWNGAISCSLACILPFILNEIWSALVVHTFVGLVDSFGRVYHCRM